MANSWYSGATKRPITSKNRSRGSSAPNALIFHIAAGESASLFSFFSNPARGCSHFYILKNGTVEQYLPISSKSGSELNGNHRTISVETQGGSSAHAKEPWTAEQVEAMSKLALWLNKEWGIPLKLMANSQPGTSGVGYHRLGIDGNFPSNDLLYSGRSQRGGGEVWTTSPGKTCPENYAHPTPSRSRIAQIPGIIQHAIDLGGTDVPDKPVPPEKPVKPPVAGKLDEDGFWGKATTKALQKSFGTPQDSVVSRQNKSQKVHNPGLTTGWEWVTSNITGSTVIRAIQEHLKKEGRYSDKVDGLCGPNTIKGIQKHYGTHVDGELWAESPAIKAMQKSLNKTGKF